VQRTLDATVWPRLFGGCHTSRDTTSAVIATGLRTQRLEHFRFPDFPIAVQASSRVVGTASVP
jgi:hypothetical protein